MKVPFYKNRDRNKTFKNNDYKWVDLKVFLNVINDKVIADFGNVSAFNLTDLDFPEYREKLKSYPPISLGGDDFVEFKNFIIPAKVLFTTGFRSKYGVWTEGTGNHHGIDLILPKGTPIESFTEGEVVRIKKWDGHKKNEGNCIVIKSNIDNEELYFCYEHLDEIKVKNKQKVKKGDIIGTCGSTGNSTTNHLHFQIDNKRAIFHPYWSKNEEDTKKYCINPWSFLQKHYSDNITNEMPDNANSNSTKSNSNENSTENDIIDDIISNLDKDDNTSYIRFFQRAGILKGDHGNLLLDSELTRYQIILILYRLAKKGFLLVKEKTCNIDFNDIESLQQDIEFQKALKLIVCNHILKGDQGKLYPMNKLKGEQFLAIIGRLFGGIEDSKNGLWYSKYLDWAKNNNLINPNWEYIGKNIKRDEVFKILFNLIMNK